MKTRSPTRTAREYAYTASSGPPEEMRCADVRGAVDGVELDLDELASGRARPLTCTSVEAGRASRK